MTSPKQLWLLCAIDAAAMSMSWSAWHSTCIWLVSPCQQHEHCRVSGSVLGSVSAGSSSIGTAAQAEWWGRRRPATPHPPCWLSCKKYGLLQASLPCQSWSCRCLTAVPAVYVLVTDSPTQWCSVAGPLSRGRTGAVLAMCVHACMCNCRICSS